MAGGRPPKPTEYLRLHGGLRDDRHADREREPKPEGDARMVVALEGPALEWWQFNVPRLIHIGLATELDSYELCAAANWYAKYKYHDANADDYRSHNMAVASYKQYRVLAAKFGLTPTDRVGLEGNRPTASDELGELIA